MSYNYCMKNYKDFAIEMANQAGMMMKKNFILGMKREWKSDNSPLTSTDTAINEYVISSVENTFPSHGILGEEISKNENREFLWVCDPIDGTVPFSTGFPTFVFSLALVVDGESILGVIYDPILERMIVAEKGMGATLNSNKINVSENKFLGKRTILNIETDLRLSRARDYLVSQGCIVSRICSIAYATILLATGQIVANIFEYSKPWDAAASKIIIDEAGGKFTDLDGKEQRYDRSINGFIASNGLVHNDLVKIITNR